MIARAETISIEREKDFVVMVIHGQGTLALGRDAAHGIAREIMRVVGEIDREHPAQPAARRFP